MLGPHFGPHFGPKPAKSPRGLQERSKRLSRGFLRASAWKMRFVTTFGPVLGPMLETLDPKKKGFRAKCIALFVISPLSIRSRCWTPFWTLLGSLEGAVWPPRWLKPVLKFVLGRPRAVQEYFFSALDDSKWGPRGEKKGSKKGPQKRT